MRTFDHFPADRTCPICGTNRDEESTLVPIAGTLDDGIAQAQVFHARCAVIQVWDEGMQMGIASARAKR